jgi:alkylation response protein AidB-like acyl-CoA dehydrogenase
MWRQEDELQSMLRESVDRYATTHDAIGRFRARRQSEGGLDRESWRAMAAAGWTSVLLPERVGGMGLDIMPALSLAEAVGRNLIAEPFLASAIIAATVLNASDKPAAVSLAQALAAGEKIVVLADQEEIRAIGPAFPQSKLDRLDQGGFELTGSKVFVPAWTDDTQLLISATLDGLPVVVAVDPRSSEVAAEVVRMTDGTLCAHLTFDKLELDPAAILLEGSAAADAIKLALARGTLALAAQLEGAAQRLFAMTADYLGQREQFGAPLASFQSIRHGLASQHLQIELAGASWRVAALKLQGALSLDALVHISAAKARCSDAALGIGKSAIHYHGAFGFTDEADISLYVNAILRWSSWLGNAQAHRRWALSLSREREQEYDAKND